MSPIGSVRVRLHNQAAQERVSCAAVCVCKPPVLVVTPVQPQGLSSDGVRLLCFPASAQGTALKPAVIPLAYRRQVVLRATPPYRFGPLQLPLLCSRSGRKVIVDVALTRMAALGSRHAF